MIFEDGLPVFRVHRRIGMFRIIIFIIGFMFMFMMMMNMLLRIGRAGGRAVKLRQGGENVPDKRWNFRRIDFVVADVGADNPGGKCQKV